MTHFFKVLLLSTVVFLMHSCVPKTESIKTQVNTNLSDPILQEVFDLQDRHSMDSLYGYLKHSDPSYRYYAALAFGSIKDAACLDSLYLVLNDPIMEVRSAAAYALGQIGDSKAVPKLITAFKTKDTINVNSLFNANILEAIGKIGDLSHLKAISSVKTYRVTDTMLLTGQIKAIYRFMLRGIVTNDGTSVAMACLSNPSLPSSTILYAAHYLARGKNLDLSLYTSKLIEIYNQSSDVNIKMALVLAMGKTKDPRFVSILKAGLVVEQDYRVKINIIKALSNYPYEDVKNELLPFLKDENTHIAATASQFYLEHGVREDLELYQSLISDSLYWQTNANLYGSILKHSPIYNTKSKGFITEKIIQKISSSTNPYEKAALIGAISHDPFNYQVLSTFQKNNKEPIVKISIIQGYNTILTSPMFYKAFGFGYPKIKAYILEELFNGIKSGDVGVISEVSKILKDPSLSWREWIKVTDVLNEQLAKLSLPKETEAYDELKSAIYYLENKPFKREEPEYNNPIDWSLVTNLTDTTTAAIKTTKGTIRVKLNFKRAPGTVGNFVKLINDKFYNGKIFHRVVPNFVVQTGCPRGDGNGSLDYSIRSELPQCYFDSEGYIGMASAGNHTESTQWFITHSQTPHLDGNYTIFGQVSEGMDVLHKLQLGDKITEIILIR